MQRDAQMTEAMGPTDGLEEIQGIVNDTIFRNEDNGYSVLSLHTGRRDITVVGSLPELATGEQLLLRGVWIEHAKYGRQFQCQSCEIQLPTTLLGIERFLASGLIAGVGPAIAKRIVNRFKEDTFRVLMEEPEKLRDIPGLGKKRWKIIAESFQEHQNLRQGMVFLQSHGVPPALSTKIVQELGENTERIVRENPYVLIERVEGVGFETADRIAMALHFPKDSPFRIQAAISYVLTDASAGQGHCYLPEEELLHQAEAFLGIHPSLLRRELDGLVLSEKLVRETPKEGPVRIWLPRFFHAEDEVARRLSELVRAVPRGNREEGMQRILAFQREHGISFSQKQKEAILQALEWGVLVITGGPGTGKTTIIRCIITLLSREGAVRLCAPTGRAAKRMEESTDREAKTIHRLLEYSGEEGQFTMGTDRPLHCSCVICDETSMVDILLMRALLRAIEPGTRLILVGDADQLPSVGAGNVLGDILQSQAIPSVRLTDIFRQSQESRIVVNAHRINHGEMPLLNEKNTDFFFDRRDTSQSASQTVVELYRTRLPAFKKISLKDIPRTIQVLTPTKKGECGVYQLNLLLQEAYNPASPTLPSLSFKDMDFRLGDKVMQTKNNYDLEWTRQGGDGEMEEGSGVFNGDLGIVADVDTENAKLSVLFDDDRLAVYDHLLLDDLDLAYCMSVHKSQGSEFPIVIMPVVPGPSMLLTRNLFYTALTRAKDMVVLVGQERVIHQMVENNQILHRYTALSECLQRMNTLY